MNTNLLGFLQELKIEPATLKGLYSAYQGKMLHLGIDDVVVDSEVQIDNLDLEFTGIGSVKVPSLTFTSGEGLKVKGLQVAVEHPELSDEFWAGITEIISIYKALIQALVEDDNHLEPIE
jgi:hypothetical protein